MHRDRQRRLGWGCLSCATFVFASPNWSLAAFTPDECVPQWTQAVGSQGVMSNLLALTALGDGDSVSHFISNSGNGVAQSTVSDWTLLGPGQLFIVRALAAFDDGRGPQLKGTIVIAMTVHDDGDAPFLYVGGFSIASSAALPIAFSRDPSLSTRPRVRAV